MVSIIRVVASRPRDHRFSPCCTYSSLPKLFYFRSVHFKLLSPEAAQLEKKILYTSKIVVMHLLEGPDLGHSTNPLLREKGK